MMNIKKNSEIPIVTLDPYEYKGFRYHNSDIEAFNFLEKYGSNEPCIAMDNRTTIKAILNMTTYKLSEN